MLGQAFEEVSKATGSVSHLYKKFEMGPNPGQCRLKINEFDPVFEAMVRECGVVSGARVASTAGEEEKKAEPARSQPEESKTTPAAPKTAAATGDARILARMGGEF